MDCGCLMRIVRELVIGNQRLVAEVVCSPLADADCYPHKLGAAI